MGTPKTLVTFLALAVLVVVLLLQLGPGDLGGEGLPVEGAAATRSSEAPAALDPSALDRAPRVAPVPPGDGREDAVPQPDEELIAPPEVPEGVEKRFFGRAVGDEDGRPIPHAEVRVEEAPMGWSSGGRARPFELSGEPVATTDLDGRFEVPLLSRGRQLATLSAEGRAPASVVVSNEHSTPEQSLEIRLARAAQLSGVVSDSPGTGDSLSVELEASRHWMMQSPVLVPGGGDVSWTAEIDSGGSFSFESLPPNIPLRARVLAGREAALKIPSPLTLSPGEHREVEWRLDSGALVSGTVLDGNGTPVPGVSLWLIPSAEALGIYLLERYQPTRRLESDAQGFFSLADLAPGDWTIGLKPKQEWVGASVRVKILPGEPPVEVTIRVAPGAYIEGRVVDPDGNGAARVFVSAYGMDGGGGSNATSEEDGAFRIGPILPGRYRLGVLMVVGDTTFAAPEEVVVHTDDPEALLRLTRGGRLAGRVIDAHTGQPVLASVSILGADDGTHRKSAFDGNADEAFDFGSLPPGSYHLIGTTEDGRVGLLRHVRVEAGSQQEGLEIPVDRGGRVRVRYEGPLEYAVIHIDWNGLNFEHDNLRSGMEKVVFLPPGEAVVQLRGRDRTSGQFPLPVLFEREERVEVVLDEIREVVFVIE